MDQHKNNTTIVIRTSGLAIASMVVGIAGIFLGWMTFGIPGFIGLPLGIIALVQIGKSKGTITGRGMAITGIITSAIPVFFLIVYFILPLFWGIEAPEIRFGPLDRAETVRLFQISVPVITA